MTRCVFLFGILFYNTVYSHESDSSEANRIEVSPLYDTIIFSDVADIINEFDNMNNPLETLINSGSESEENMEDLLSEYQHYLEKAHKQRSNFLEKSKSKNKVPLTRHEKFSKTKPGMTLKYDNNYFPNFYSKNPQTSFNSPLDFFIPITQKLKFYNKADRSTTSPSHDELSAFDKRIIDIPALSPLRHEALKSSCYCKNGQYPCDCKCKQCYIAFEPYSALQQPKYYVGESNSNSLKQPFMINSEYPEEKAGEANDFNIKVKVDIQLPKMLEKLIDTAGKLLRNHGDESNSKEFPMTTGNLPIPYFNFSVPIDLVGYKKKHRISIHKKKNRSRQSNSNKKHRKKLITLHNFNIEPQNTIKMQQNFTMSNRSVSDYQKIFDHLNKTVHISLLGLNVTAKTDLNLNNSETPYKVEEIIPVPNITKTDDSINETANVSGNFLTTVNTFDNITDDARRTENSVEGEYPKIDSNIATEKQLGIREKREVDTQNTNMSTSPIPGTSATKFNELKVIMVTTTETVNNNSIGSKPTTLSENKIPDKGSIIDSELLYWPNVKISKNLTKINQNITTIILERETKKAKLNMTKDTIRHNRTKVLERAIFGDVNWDDVDTVAPVFMSFVGKYIRGALTFCSQNICHSMKCGEKTCVHRVCDPSQRWNQRGHCSGSNSTDSFASLESIMDLPSNIAFEIVEILQDKMLGKLFGKVTLCISSKCISFVASKKNFLKSKCTNKELNKTGHCPNVKNFKIM